MLRTHSVLAFAALAALPASAQVFTDASASIPATGSPTDSVDLADVDLDGDLDAVVGNGAGWFGSNTDQSELWINQGGLQGGVLGVFVDATAARMPVLSASTTDVEFADYDGDGDPDLAVSNTAQLLNQSSLFFTNLGGAQGGTLGFYANETASRWIGLGGPGSSVNPAFVLGSGGFIDWTWDSDFADLDDDGDLDLVHTSAGGAFGGNVPTRLFLNDGGGHFSEFAPAGLPTLWCAAPATITTSCLGVEVADLDADYDAEIVLGSRQTAPRLFLSTVTQAGGPSLYTDITSTGFPAGYWSGADNYEQELGDMDGDLDLDLLGVNWPGLNDAVFNNAAVTGAASFAGMTTLTNSGNDDDNADLADLDADGKIDASMAGSGVRQNTSSGTPGTFAFNAVSTAYWGVSNIAQIVDSAVGDVNGDGAADLLQAHVITNEILWRSTLASGDTSAPAVPMFTDVIAHTAGASALLLHAHIFDDSSIADWDELDTALGVTVDGFDLGEIACFGLAGPAWRVALYGNLVGQVGYRFESTDRAGNTGTSTLRNYTGSTSLAFKTPYGAGSPGALGVPNVHALSVPFAGTTFFLGGSGAPASTPGFLALTDAAVPGAPLPLPGLCNLNVIGNTLLLKSVTTDANGRAVTAIPVPASVPAGISVYAQFFALDGQGGNLLSSSAGLRVDTQ